MVNKTDPDLNALIHRAWPAGLTAQERLAVATMPQGTIMKVARRLDAILAWTEPLAETERPKDMAAAAGLAGVSVPRFYGLLASWRKSRSLHSLGLRFAVRKHGRLEGAQPRELVTRVREVLANSPDLGTGAIVRAVAAEDGEVPSRTTLIRAVAEARRMAPPGEFGRTIVLDAAPLDIVDLDGERVWLSIVLDEGTGVALGWVLGSGGPRLIGQLWAVEFTFHRLKSLELGALAVFDGEPELDLRIGPEDEEGRRAIEQRIRLAPAKRHVSERGLGRALVSALGRRVAGVWIGTGRPRPGRGLRTGRDQHLPATDLDQIDGPFVGAVDVALERHNAARVAAAGTVGDGGHTSDVLLRVETRLREFLEAADALAELPDYVEGMMGMRDFLPG